MFLVFKVFPLSFFSFPSFPFPIIYFSPLPPLLLSSLPFFYSFNILSFFYYDLLSLLLLFFSFPSLKITLPLFLYFHFPSLSLIIISFLLYFFSSFFSYQLLSLSYSPSYPSSPLNPFLSPPVSLSSHI